jgi:hypothetical protein
MQASMRFRPSIVCTSLEFGRFRSLNVPVPDRQRPGCAEVNESVPG